MDKPFNLEKMSVLSHKKKIIKKIRETGKKRLSFQEVQCIQNTAFQHFPVAFVRTNKFPDQKASHNPHFA